VAAAYLVLVAGVGFGVLPVTALLMLVTIPLALRVSRGLGPNYENPYGLMAIMGLNVQLHLRAGLLLLAAYAVVLVLGALAPTLDLFLG
jgi:1,4-dihydroxy-2-naphthoate octaprenyltransferase